MKSESGFSFAMASQPFSSACYESYKFHVSFITRHRSPIYRVGADIKGLPGRLLYRAPTLIHTGGRATPLQKVGNRGKNAFSRSITS